MKRFVLIVLAGLAGVAAVRGAADPEADALQVLRSNAPLPEKENACLQLKRVATAQSVPVLADLLTVPELYQWALDVLETLPGPEAGQALRDALPRTAGVAQAGIIHALGVRGDRDAALALSQCLSAPDPIVAIAAAQALGKIGEAPRPSAFLAALNSPEPRVRLAAADGMLALAEHNLKQGKVDQARELYRFLRRWDGPPQVRAALFRGEVFCAGDFSADRVIEALTGADPVEQLQAIQLVRTLSDPRLTLKVTAVLTNVSPVAQVALVDALAQRGDPAAVDGIAQLSSTDAAVRMASLIALGELGDASQVPLLAARAATGPSDERDAARQALVSLRRGDVFAAMLAEVTQAPAPVQLELVQAMSDRGDPQAAASLLELAEDGAPAVRVIALRALGGLATDEQAPGLLALVVSAPDPKQRNAAQSAFIAAGLRSRHQELFSGPALTALQSASAGARPALLEAAGQIGGPGVTEALRHALREPDPGLADAALRTMADHGTAETLPDLLQLARESSAEVPRTLALRGYWRLVNALGDEPSAARLSAIRAGLQVSSNPAAIKMGLSRLGGLGTPEALTLARQYLAESEVRPEAELACLQIAERLDYEQRALGEEMLRELGQPAVSDAVRAQAKALLERATQHDGYLMPWEVSGPYRQAGAEASELFDAVFPPERPGDRSAAWQPLPVVGPWVDIWMADLGPVTGGDHCVVYLRTRVYSPVRQDVALDLGSDDGIKLWINGALVHANNAVRGFTPDADHAKATLESGWNEFLAKITQHTAGCAAAVRVRGPNQTLLPGLRVAVAP